MNSTDSTNASMQELEADMTDLDIANGFIAPSPIVAAEIKTEAKRGRGRPKKSAACAECGETGETYEALKQHSRDTGHYFEFKINQYIRLRVAWNNEGMYFPKAS
jgi:hypothetical protein